MIIPTKHLNGTSEEELLNQVCDAAHALRLALAAMRSAAPNARDYSVQSPDAFKLAVEEHEARIQQVKDVLSQYQELAEKIVLRDFLG